MDECSNLVKIKTEESLQRSKKDLENMSQDLSRQDQREKMTDDESSRENMCAGKESNWVVTDTDISSEERETLREKITDDESSQENMCAGIESNCVVTDTDISSVERETMDSFKDSVDHFSDNCSDDSDNKSGYESVEEGDDDIELDEENLKKIEESLSESAKEERQKMASEEREMGNNLFKQTKYEEAQKHYTKGLQICPLSFKKDRAIMYSNRGACKLKMEKYSNGILDCSKAIELHPVYLKAILRRAELYEKVEKLDEALTDYQRVVELDPSQHSARAACIRLPEEIKLRNEKLKEEMLSKLKDLGNMVLKPFGLSTNNFQMQQDPETGSYSVKFNQNGK